MYSVLKQKKSVIVEAKRVIINEQLETFANQVSDDLNVQIFPRRNKMAKNVNSTQKKQPLSLQTIKQSNVTKTLLKKYFKTWLRVTKSKRDHLKQLNKQIEQKEKLDNFLKMLKKSKKQEKILQKSSVKERVLKEPGSKIIAAIQTVEIIPNDKTEGDNFKHRFKAQQSIIETQKAKLVEQEKIIQELKLGKINEEIQKSIENTKIDIRETFSKCSNKIKCKIKPTIDDASTESFKLHLISSKAPKIVQKMEMRALERAERRHIILERKRILDEQKKKQIEHEIESKRTQDEEERKQNLKAIKERRMKELEIEQKRQLQKQIYLELVAKSDKFYKYKLVFFGFKAFTKLVMIKQENIIKSEIFYESTLMKKSFQNWLDFILKIDAIKNRIVDGIFKKRLLRNMLKQWHNVYFLRKQSMQVAVDLYELQLQSKTFILWHRYTCSQYVLRQKNMIKAERHFQSRILLQYFYQWRSLPAVLQLEKAKEEKKRKWREKVWEILPDYCPVVDV